MQLYRCPYGLYFDQNLESLKEEHKSVNRRAVIYINAVLPVLVGSLIFRVQRTRGYWLSFCTLGFTRDE